MLASLRLMFYFPLFHAKTAHARLLPTKLGRLHACFVQHLQDVIVEMRVPLINKFIFAPAFLFASYYMSFETTYQICSTTNEGHILRGEIWRVELSFDFHTFCTDIGESSKMSRRRHRRRRIEVSLWSPQSASIQPRTDRTGFGA